MGTTKAAVPRQAQAEGTPGLTKGQKVIGLCLLLFYLAMIGVTIATLPYVVSIEAGGVFERAGGSF